MKKIAVPITKNNKIEEHFGHSEFYEIYTFSNTNKILDLQLLKSDKVCGCKSNLPNLLATRGVTYLLSDRIGDKAVTKLSNAGIDVIRGCSGDSADVILKFVEGEISDSQVSCLHHHKEQNHVCNH